LRLRGYFSGTQLGERDGEDYRYGFTTNRTILEEKEYETSAVVVYLAVSCVPTLLSILVYNGQWCASFGVAVGVI
jgi:hypothetical protein